MHHVQPGANEVGLVTRQGVGNEMFIDLHRSSDKPVID